MAISFSGDKRPQVDLKEIQVEVYADWDTFRDGHVDVQTGFKAGADVTEAKVSVNMLDYDSDEIVAGSDQLIAETSPVNLTKIMFADRVDYNTLLNTRFEKSMQAGAFNTVSSEFDNKVLQQISPAISQTMEYEVWSGVLATTKTAIAGLTAGAGQGSISASAQSAIAGITNSAGKFDGLLAKILYNDSRSKSTGAGVAGLGDYVKVPNALGGINATNIADEYSKTYATLDPKILKAGGIKIYAPLSHRQTMRIANNSVGASSNQNFTFNGDGIDAKAYYNGVEVLFKPLPEDIMIATNPMYLKILMDLTSDISELRTGEVANGADKMWYKNVQSIATWVTNQRYIVLYGG